MVDTAGVLHRGRHAGTTAPVPSDTSDAQWVVIEPLLPAARAAGAACCSCSSGRAGRDLVCRADRVCLAGVAGGLPALADRLLVLNQWEQQKVTEKILPVVRGQLRIAEGRDPEPSAGIIDSQSVKGADTVGRTPAATTPGRRQADGNGSS
nr:hypothetical protein [Pseudonocardia sp. ICBG601]